MPVGAHIENSPERVVIRGLTNPSLVTPLGDPVPPQDVVRRLADYNRTRGTRYSIEWVRGAWGVQYYGLFETWSERDPRREYIQRGMVDPGKDRDIVTMFPTECSPQEMMSYIENRFGRLVLDPRAEAQAAVEAAQKNYEEVMASQVEQAVETGTQKVLDESNHQRLVRGGYERAHPMVGGVTFWSATDTKNPGYTGEPIVEPVVDTGPKRLLALNAVSTVPEG